ncbi:MAG: phosphatidylserine decarboxylase family protein [Flavobacteriales bacterium]
MTLHKEGTKIIAGTLLVAAAIIIITRYFFCMHCIMFWVITIPVLVMVYLVLQFFRLPKRENKSAPDELVAPCDGKVVVIEEVEEPEFFKDKRIQISIFMSPLNVHANWVPCEGEVKYTKYHAGLYLVAWHPKSSTENERTTIVLERQPGQQVLFRQIAGAVARRIVYYVKPGDRVQRNQQFGFIKFGSRVDIFLPSGTDVKVKIGDLTKGNETVIARWK